MILNFLEENANMQRSTNKYLYIIVLLAALCLALVACTAATPAPTTEPVAPPPAPTCPAPAACPEVVVGPEVPFQVLWEKSAHNAADTEAFKHWDDTTDKSVPVACATCHSATGFQDFLGADGSEAGKVDKPAPIGTTINCTACHNEAAAKLTSVTFPSGAVINNLGPEARCMVCHQGRASKVQVDAKIETFKATDMDAVVAPIKNGDTVTNFGFVNVHYFAAAATLYGTEVKGGYEYDGKTYDAKNDHVEGYSTCVGCHNPHTLEVKVTECALCHEGVKTVADLKNIRMVSSAPDYDGDGNVTEGMAGEIEGLQAALYGAIQGYAKEVAGLGIVYDAATNPYFFADADGNGKADTTDKGNTTYSAWTPRLLKAAYNYQVSIKDPGTYAHGNKYIVQLLFDSIEDLNAKLGTPVDMSKMHRNDAGHFAGNAMAFRDWDSEGEVPAGCAKCHSAGGLPQFLHNNGTLVLSKTSLNVTGIVGQPTSNGFLCSTCHDESNFPAVLSVVNVPFPSGASLTFSTEKDDKGALKPVAANTCIECHQGRESTVSVNNALAAFKDLDTADAKIRFRNVHYFAAGATLFGTDAKGIYEYAGKEYLGRFMHDGNLNTCTSCHDPHVLAAKTDTCKGCHQVDDPAKIRMNSKDDYDGDGNVTEGLKGEVDTYSEKLYAAILAYAKDVAGTGIVYDAASYPYFFVDKDGDGKADKDDKGATIAYNAFTPRLLKAAYNYQYSIKDPGAYVHNAKYVMQALYDSMADLKTKVPSIDMTGMKRP
jgi:hypothetical protein